MSRRTSSCTSYLIEMISHQYIISQYEVLSKLELKNKPDWLLIKTLRFVRMIMGKRKRDHLREQIRNK